MKARCGHKALLMMLDDVIERGGAYSFVAWLGHLTIDHASLWRRSTGPTRNRDTSSIFARITFFSIYHIKVFRLPCPLPDSPLLILIVSQ